MAIPPRVRVASVAQNRRVNRSPIHPFLIRHVPFVINPFFIAPVLAGETLKNLLVQSRVVTDPIKNPLIGWWVEYYFFYVKLRDLDLRDEFTKMVLDPNWSSSTVTTALGTAFTEERYFAGGAGQIDYVRACLNRVVTEYFRDEGDDETAYTLTDAGTAQPLAQIGRNSVLDSVVQADDRTAVDVGITVGVDDVVTASEIEQAQRKWEQLKAYGLTEMTFEDYLASFGVRPARQETHRPELVRYLREWSYPTNTIDPTNGTPRSAVSWSIQERADKDRFFPEPGFLFGVTICRPKVYYRWQKGSFTSSMNDVFSWLPKVLHDDVNASWKLIPDEVGPLGAVTADTDGYWVDMKDLFLHGEQYTNISTTELNQNMVELPSSSLNNRFFVPTLANIQEFFVTGASAYYVRQDGVVSLNVAGSLRETSPRGGSEVSN